MARRNQVLAGLLSQARIIGYLAAAILFGLAFPGCAANPSSGRASLVGPPPASRAAGTSGRLSGSRSLPGPTIVSEIHNAPGWQPSHTYTYATRPYTRVVNGPGWNVANRSYNPGQTLDAYQLISPGTCTSASSGGPLSRGPSIADGTCTWKYLSRVDYISITGWAFDNQAWKSGRLYHYLDIVTSGSPLRAYALENRGCLSTVAPAGTGNGPRAMIVTSDGCHWHYQADIIYTSKRSYIPTETFTSPRSAATLMLRANYEARLWNDREYVAGKNGEASPIRLQTHDDYRHEGGVILGCTALPCFHLIITTAPGESFRDILTPSDPLTGFDPAKGVAILNSLPYRWPFEPAGIDVHDNYIDLIGLQIKSVHGAAVNGMSSFGNAMTIRDCILVGGSNNPWTSRAAVTTDTSSVIANSLVISNGPIGIALKYPGFVLHSTVVHLNRTANSVGIETFNKWVYNNSTVSNTAIFGFAHAVAHDESHTSWSHRSSHNITDAPLNDSGTGPRPYGNTNPPSATVDILPGTIYGASMEAAFVRPGSDWRLSPHSPLRGAGSAFGTFAVGCNLLHPFCPQRKIYNFDTPDIIGTARPEAGRYDIGAWQSCPFATRRSRCSSPYRPAPANP